MFTTHHNPEERIIGIVGQAGAGKDSVAEDFISEGYEHISSGNCVREEIAARGLTASRTLQTAVANEMRALYGPEYWAAQAVKRARAATKTGKIIISGLYAPTEGMHLTTAVGGTIVGVRASTGDVQTDLIVRFNRVTLRSDGTRDDMTLEQFEAAYQRENSGTQPHEPNINDLLAQAQFTIVNDSDELARRMQVASIIAEVEGR